MAQRRITRA
jgi:hypothetical protein